MNFKEIIDLTKNRIDETDVDEQIDSIIKNAINHSYLFDLSIKDQHVKTAYITPVNGIATLPSDILKIINISPALTKGEYRVGNVIVSNREVDFTVIYSVVPKPMVSDTDKPSISERYHYSMSTYACAEYYNFKKKTSNAQIMADMYLNEISKLDSADDNLGEETVYDVIGGE
jgi:hypothetical protein